MARVIRQPFTPGGKFTVSQSFRFHGRAYAKGDEFPWRTLSCSVRKLRSMYEGRLLNNLFVDEDSLIDETPEVVKTEEVTVIDGKAITAYDPDIHEIINPDRGEWYLADVEGNRLLKVTAKEGKRLRKKHEAEIVNPDGIIKE